MKKIFGIFGVALILFGSVCIAPSWGMSIDQDLENLELRLLIVIAGTVNVCSEEKELYGFGVIIYTSGETSMLTNYSIGFQGLPFFITKGLLLSVCIYIPANI